MAPKHKSIVERLASEAIHLGAGALEVEYEDACEVVFAVKDGIGYGKARLGSSGPEAASSGDEILGITRRRRRMTAGEREYELRGI